MKRNERFVARCRVWINKRKRSSSISLSLSLSLSLLSFFSKYVSTFRSNGSLDPLQQAPKSRLQYDFDIYNGTITMIIVRSFRSSTVRGLGSHVVSITHFYRVKLLANDSRVKTRERKSLTSLTDLHTTQQFRFLCLSVLVCPSPSIGNSFPFF